MKASDYIVQFLATKGVTVVFELSGGMITHLLDSLNRHGGVKVVSARHEQAAAFAADAFGRLTGIPGVALATSGPGATNLLTGIGSCYFDSSPAVFITGQVNRNEQKGSRHIRQLGFQETDIVAMAAPITKAAWKVENVADLPNLLEKAFALAVHGRPGPVLLDIPMDVQRGDLSEEALKSRANKPAESGVDAQIPWSQISSLFQRAERPLILAGGGIRASQGIIAFQKLVNKWGIPVVNSLMGVDALPFGHPLRVGLIGTYGNRWANLALGRSDLLLVLGSRLDVRQTGASVEAFKKGREIIHVDCEQGEVNNRVVGCHAILTDLKCFLSESEAKLAFSGSYGSWLDEITALRAKWPDENEIRGIEGINPNHFIHLLSQASLRAATFVVDVGLHQMWAAQSIELRGDQRYLTTGGMGSMGFALPAAIGACATKPGSSAVVIAGDGGFQCNLQELQTVAHHQYPLKMIVMNNHSHGMVRQFQESYFNSRFQSTVWGYSAPDFVKVAEAFGIPARRVEAQSTVSDSLAWLWNDPTKPALLELVVDKNANAYPKVAFGQPITVMEP
jgi:acetolactate synthase-1/2/3 large subunit